MAIAPSGGSPKGMLSLNGGLTTIHPDAVGG